MKIDRALDQTILRVLLPRPTVRWRLTLLYTALFLLCGAALLAITNELFAHFAYSFPHKPRIPPGSNPSTVAAVKLASAVSRARPVYLHKLLIESGIALGIMAIVSGVLAWIVAGRVLAPLRTITAATEQISDTNLHERLGLEGPRDELRQLAETIDRLLERLEAAFEAQRRFVANASHELRTPLAMMRTTLDVAIAKPGGVPPQTHALESELRVDLDHADRLLESFLSLARAQNGQLEERDQVSLEPLINTALADRSAQITAKQLDVEVRLTDLAVTGSAILLRRMLENVVENAVRHNRPGGSIDMTLRAIGDNQAQLTVESSGPPLDPHAVAQLAQPFKRLTQDRTGTQDGHGLGLSIVAAVTAAHGGTLQLHARDQGGLRVQITLPAAAVPQLAEAVG